jgi:hypothetical protein
MKIETEDILTKCSFYIIKGKKRFSSTFENTGKIGLVEIWVKDLHRKINFSLSIGKQKITEKHCYSSFPLSKVDLSLQKGWYYRVKKQLNYRKGDVISFAESSDLISEVRLWISEETIG